MTIDDSYVVTGLFNILDWILNIVIIINQDRLILIENRVVKIQESFYRSYWLK